MQNVRQVIYSLETNSNSSAIKNKGGICKNMLTKGHKLNIKESAIYRLKFFT